MPSANKSKRSSKNAEKSAARLSAVQAVYQMFENQQKPQSIIEEYTSRRLGKSIDGEHLDKPDTILFKQIVAGVANRIDDLNPLVVEAATYNKKNTKGDEKAKFSAFQKEPLIRAILLCGAYELLAHHDIDSPIIISDYLNVTHAFYEKGEAKLINAVLDNVKHAVRSDSSD